MDESQRLLGLFREKNAFLEGHFLLSSGLHSPNYMQCALILQYPDIAEELGTSLSKKVSAADLVLSPAMGGIIIGHEVAKALKTRFIFCERENGVFRLRRGFQIAPGEKVLVVEDVVTTGKSTRETITVAEQAGAKVTGVASIVDRSLESPGFPGTYHSLLRLPLTVYEAASCPLCKENVPVVKPGSRR